MRESEEKIFSAKDVLTMHRFAQMYTQIITESVLPRLETSEIEYAVERFVKHQFEGRDDSLPKDYYEDMESLCSTSLKQQMATQIIIQMVLENIDQDNPVLYA